MRLASVYPIGAIALSVPLVFSFFSVKSVPAVFKVQTEQQHGDQFSSPDQITKSGLLADKFPSPRRVLREEDSLA